TRQFTATGVFSDESVQNLTEQVSWSAADGAVASVSNEAGSRGLVTPAGIGSTAVSATRDGVTGSTGFTVTEAVLVSIQITPSHPSAPTGTTLHLTATGVYSDHTTQDLSKQVAWSSSDPSVASVSNAAGSNGLAAALAVGAADVSASLDGVTGSTGFTVTEAVLVSIQVTPANPSLARGTTLQLTATGAYTDDTTRDLTKNVTWGSTNPSVASVSNADGSDGLATALAVGSTSVSATLGSVSASTILTVTAATLVSIRVEPADAVTALDVSLEFTATGLYSDGSTQDLTQCVTWSSTDPVVASVSNAEDSRGLATPVGPGSTGVFAALGGLWGSTTLTVSDASLVSLSVTPRSPSIQSGTTIQFTATGYYSGGMTLDITRSAVWKSSDNKVAKVSNARKRRGLAEGDEAGTATLSAKLGGLSGTAVLTVE
nr:Ig-like domain-containing protein [Desulfobacterales bacterium]